MENQMNCEEFKLLDNEARLEVIQNLHSWFDREKILEWLLSVLIETLDAELLGELAKAYNNTGEYEKAMAVLDQVVEEQRDAKWYYRYAYSHSELATNPHYDLETEARNAFEKLENAVKLTNDEAIIRWCLELVSMSRFESILEDKKENYPFLSEKYFAYMNDKNKRIEEAVQAANAQKKERLKNLKITIEDIKKSDESWDVCKPMFELINIYDGYEQYLKSAEGFTLEQRYLSAIHWYWGEVINGGHHQFFYNSTGIVWQDALNGFKHFGMPEFADNFQKVVDYCGGTISFDRQERWNMLEELEEKNGEELWAVLGKADDFVYKHQREEGEWDYIKAHPEQFVFDGASWVY